MVVTDLKGRILSGRYRLTQVLGQGGMALVFEAFDDLLQRNVAIKLLRKDYSIIPGFRDRFLQEARAAANLIHPNIVSVYDFGIDSGEIFIVMELANGSDLKSLIQSGEKFSIQEGLDLGIQICAGLGYAHRAGIVHCDVKPQNIIVTRDNLAKITDFGIARAMSVSSSAESNDVVWGSPQYMAPEIIGGAVPTPQADVYSIGAVLYELFTGIPPFDGTNVDEILSRQKHVLPNSIRLINSDFPEELDMVILKSLSKEPNQRYRSADQLGNVLMMIKNRLGLNSEFALRAYTPPPITTISYEDSPSSNVRGNIDWPIIGLELLCVLMIGGLIPFWLFVYFYIRPLLG